MVGGQGGGVGAVGQADRLRVGGVLGQEPVRALRGDTAGGVGVGGDDGAWVHGGELAGLLPGHRRPQRSDPDEPAQSGEGDGVGVQGAFDEHRHRAGLEEFGCGAVELGALVEQGGVRGVEVLRAGRAVVGGVGVAAADEPEDVPVVGDGHDGPVAEAVDEPPGARGGREPGLEELGVGDPAPAEVVDEVGPPGRCVPGGGVRGWSARRG